eukprot:COSAG02_NODE_1982_length_10196_cov_6.214816_17_plen_71_part_00
MFCIRVAFVPSVICKTTFIFAVLQLHVLVRTSQSPSGVRGRPPCGRDESNEQESTKSDKGEYSTRSISIT